MRRRPDDRPLSPEIGGRVDSRGQGLDNPADYGILGKGPIGARRCSRKHERVELPDMRAIPDSGIKLRVHHEDECGMDDGSPGLVGAMRNSGRRAGSARAMHEHGGKADESN